MRKDFTLTEFNQIFNESKPIFELSTKLSFFDVRVINNLLLVQEKQYYCRITENNEIHRYSLSLVLEIVQNKLNRYAILAKRRTDESICETDYYYIFYLK